MDHLFGFKIVIYASDLIGQLMVYQFIFILLSGFLSEYCLFLIICSIFLPFNL